MDDSGSLREVLIPLAVMVFGLVMLVFNRRMSQDLLDSERRGMGRARTSFKTARILTLATGALFLVAGAYGVFWR